MVTGVPGAAFGLAFNEASGACLVRAEGNDEGLRAAAIDSALALGSGTRSFYTSATPTPSTC